MEIVLNTLMALVIMSFAQAGFTTFISFCISRDGIFSFWLPMLSSWIWKPNQIQYKEMMSQYTSNGYDISFLNNFVVASAVYQYPILKPLGACEICMNFWLCLSMYWVYAAIAGLSWYFIIPFIFLTHIMLQILYALNK